MASNMMTAAPPATRNTLTAQATWADICRLGAGMTNSIGAEAKDGLMYMATESISGREWTAGEAVHDADAGIGVWLGFEEAGSSRFLWSSASSGAEIEAVREDGDGPWTMRFRGSEDSTRESFYASAFALAADPDSVRVESLPYGRAFRQVLEHWLENRVILDTHWGAAPGAIQWAATAAQIARIERAIETVRSQDWTALLEHRLEQEELQELQYGRGF